EKYFPRLEECTKDCKILSLGRKGHYSHECPENASLVPQSEKEGDMDAYIAGDTIPTRRERPKCKQKSSLDGLNHIPKIRRAVNSTLEKMDISDKNQDTCDEFEYESEELEEKEEYYTEERSDRELYENPWENMQSLAIYMTTLEKIPTCDEDHDKCRNDEGTPKQNIDIRLIKEEQEEATKFFEKEKNLFAKDIMNREAHTPITPDNDILDDIILKRLFDLINVVSQEQNNTIMQMEQVQQRNKT
ncbi:4588_t:CDS:2, partial [Acaulospora morrowiae]